MTGRALSGLFTVADYERSARTVLVPSVWDFVAGGAGAERTVAANREAFARASLRPRVLSGVGVPTTGITLFGRQWPMPIAIAPLAYHTLMDPEGEVATARAAAA